MSWYNDWEDEHEDLLERIAKAEIQETEKQPQEKVVADESDAAKNSLSSNQKKDMQMS